MSDTNTSLQAVSLFKRLMVILYDLLLLTAVLFTAGVVVASILTFTLNDGNAITESHRFYITTQFIIISVLLFAGLFFFGWFWTLKGQTLGMKTWRVQLISTDEDAIDWNKMTIRYLVAIVSWGVFGLGFIWSLFDKEKRTWHDIASATKLVQLPKE